MSSVYLDETTQLSGLLSLIGICVMIIFAALFIHRAIKNRVKILYPLAIFILSINSPWYPSGFGFLLWLLTGTIFNYQAYVLLGTIGIPIAMLAWFFIYTSILHPNLKKYFLFGFGILSIIFYIYMFYFLFFASGAPVEAMIGIKETPLDIEYKSFVLIFIGTILIIGVPTFLEFSISSLRTKENPEIQWRGRFLLLGNILFVFCAFLDALFVLNPIFLIIVRIFLLIATLLFYMGFVMPDWVKRMLNLDLEQ